MVGIYVQSTQSHGQAWHRIANANVDTWQRLYADVFHCIGFCLVFSFPCQNISVLFVDVNHCIGKSNTDFQLHRQVLEYQNIDTQVQLEICIIIILLLAFRWKAIHGKQKKRRIYEQKVRSRFKWFEHIEWWPCVLIDLCVVFHFEINTSFLYLT